jgi:molybdopterin molybdotransferase
MVREFTEYVPLDEALDVLKRSVKTAPRREIVPIGEAFGRILFADVVSGVDVPSTDSSHMDGFAVRSSDLSKASEKDPVTLKVVRGSQLGVVPVTRVRRGEAHGVLTGGYLPRGADAIIQSERVGPGPSAEVIRISEKVGKGNFVFARGRDIKKGELVLKKGRSLRGADLVLLASLHVDKVGVYRKPRVAIIPTGNELSSNIKGTEPGKVVETHGLLLSRLVEGAGGLPIPLPIALDDLKDIERSIRRALRIADIVLTLAGSSVGEPDLTERAIASSGKPGVLVHGMKVFRGRVMGFGAVGGKAIVILPGPIQGAVNAFALMGYPTIRALLGRGFEEPPSLPATIAADWDAGNRYADFSKVVYARVKTEGEDVLVEPSKGETEKVTHLTQNDGYIVVGEDKISLKKGERVRVHLLPGLSGFPFRGSD